MSAALTTDRSTRQAVVALPAGGLGEFFRYHGPWAPGVRLFRSIGFRAKASVISAVFAVPILVLAQSFFSDVQASLEFSRKERVGLAYAQAAAALLPGVAAARAEAATAATWLARRATPWSRP